MGAPGHTGDGLLMAAEAGAAIAESIPIFHEGPFPIAAMGISMAGIVKEPGTVWVNQNGRGLLMKTAGYLLWDSGNAILMQPELTMYTLMDDAIRQQFEENGLVIGMGGNEARTALPGLEKDLRELARKSPLGLK